MARRTRSQRRWLGGAAVGVVALVAAGCSPPLDPDFGGGDGIATIGGPSISADNAAAVAVQPDGKILLVFTSTIGGTSHTIARFHPDGSVDTTFDGDGRVEVARFAQSYCADILVLPDEKYVVSSYVPHVDGSQNTEPGLARYNSDGSLDTTFGRGGTTYVDGIEPCDLELQPDGKIVASVAGRGDGMQATRFLPDGSIDTAFGTDGLAHLRIPHEKYFQYPTAMALQPDGKIVVAGVATELAQVPGHAAVVRFNADGTPDLSFAGQGGVVEDLGGPAADVAVRPDGRVVIAGNVEPRYSGTGKGHFLLAQFTPAGALDPTFGEGGAARAVDDGVGLAMALLDDGKVVVVGREWLPNYSESDERDGYTSVRFNVDGTIDESYVPGGIGTTDNFEGPEWASDVVVHPDGGLIVAGTVPGQDPTIPPDPYYTDIGLYRYDVG